MKLGANFKKVKINIKERKTFHTDKILKKRYPPKDPSKEKYQYKIDGLP